MLIQQDFLDTLNPNLDPKIIDRCTVAFRTLRYQDEYCWYHYEMFEKELELFKLAESGKLEGTEITDSQYYRIAFEANVYAFIRGFHSLIESVPYLLNILIEANKDIEDQNIDWQSITKFCKSSGMYSNAEIEIRKIRESDSYKELRHIVNVSKHRRLVRIDSGMLSMSQTPRFHADDLDNSFRSYEVKVFMETIYNELHPQIINVIKYFQVTNAQK